MLDFFQTSQSVPFPVERVFRFFADPKNLPRISPPESRARIVRLELAGPRHHPDLAGAGTLIQISVRLLPPLPFRGRWVARIVDFEYGKCFRDVQVRGPFKRWEHLHWFEEKGATTLVRDIVQYEVGWGALGDAVNAMFVRRALEKMFEYRKQATERLLSAQG